MTPDEIRAGVDAVRRHPAFAGRAGRDWRRAVAGALIVAVAVLLARGWLA